MLINLSTYFIKVDPNACVYTQTCIKRNYNSDNTRLIGVTDTCCQLVHMDEQIGLRQDVLTMQWKENKRTAKRQNC